MNKLNLPINQTERSAYHLNPIIAARPNPGPLRCPMPARSGQCIRYAPVVSTRSYI